MSLPAYVIYIDEYTYDGEDLGITADTPEPRVGSWQEHRQTEHPIRLGNNGLLIEGDRNLASHIERILTAKRQGRLEFHELVVRQLDEEDAEGRRRKRAIDEVLQHGRRDDGSD